MFSTIGYKYTQLKDTLGFLLSQCKLIMKSERNVMKTAGVDHEVLKYLTLRKMSGNRHTCRLQAIKHDK